MMIEGNIGIYVSSAPFETLKKAVNTYSYFIIGITWHRRYYIREGTYLKKAVNTGWYFNGSDFIVDAIRI